MLVEFRREHGGKVAVNPVYVKFVEEIPGTITRTFIDCTSDKGEEEWPASVRVLETYREVMAKLSAGQPDASDSVGG